MIGIYDYTVVLTYLSLLSAGTGIAVALAGSGHPYLGTLFLLICGLCDAFDGKVARTKKNRTAMERSFGIQIDSLSDLVAFGVLPACIGIAMLRNSDFFSPVIDEANHIWYMIVIKVFLFAVLILYMLAAMIRLAYYNVTEEERQETESGCRKYYLGVPVTTASLIFPSVALLQYITPFDVTAIYFATVIILGSLFVTKIRVKKPQLRGILFLIGIGAVEFIVLIIFHFFIKPHLS